jgi:hypothetical protein
MSIELRNRMKALEQRVATLEAALKEFACDKPQPEPRFEPTGIFSDLHETSIPGPAIKRKRGRPVKNG